MMNKLVFALTVLVPSALSAQFFTGYYVSDPPVQDFDHFKIKHHTEHEDKFDGILNLHAFIEHDEVWNQEAETIIGAEADEMILKYGRELDILSVHKMKMTWDGIEWEFFLLGYLNPHSHGEFIVVEEIFEDETESKLLSVNRFHWIKAHHIRDHHTSGSK